MSGLVVIQTYSNPQAQPRRARTARSLVAICSPTRPSPVNPTFTLSFMKTPAKVRNTIPHPSHCQRARCRLRQPSICLARLYNDACRGPNALNWGEEVMPFSRRIRCRSPRIVTTHGYAWCAFRIAASGHTETEMDSPHRAAN